MDGYYLKTLIFSTLINPNCERTLRGNGSPSSIYQTHVNPTEK